MQAPGSGTPEDNGGPEGPEGVKWTQRVAGGPVGRPEGRGPAFPPPGPDLYCRPMATDERQEFRLRPVLKVLVGAAAALWSVILLVLVVHGEKYPVRIYMSVVFFIALFTAVLVFYQGMTISTDRYGVTYRGLVTFRTYPYESILKLDVRPGLTGLVTYDVFTKAGLLQFSSFIQDHKRLMEIIVERADLARRGRVSQL